MPPTLTFFAIQLTPASGLEEAEGHALTEKSADVVLGLLNSAANQPSALEAGGGEATEPWPEQAKRDDRVVAATDTEDQ